MNKTREKKNFGEHAVLVKVCSKCGSTELASPSLGSYSPEALLIPGVNEITGVKECVKCGYCGHPVEKLAKIIVERRSTESFFGKLKRKILGKKSA